MFLVPNFESNFYFSFHFRPRQLKPGNKTQVRKRLSLIVPLNWCILFYDLAMIALLLNYEVLNIVASSMLSIKRTSSLAIYANSFWLSVYDL